MSFQEVGGATNLRFSHKVIAVLMSIVVALGLCPIAQPSQAYAETVTPATVSAASTLSTQNENANPSPTFSINFSPELGTAKDGVVTFEGGTITVNPSAALNASPGLSVNKSATLTVEPKTGYELKGEVTAKASNGSATLTADSTSQNVYKLKVNSKTKTVVTVHAEFQKLAEKIAVPTANSGLIYNGSEQTGVSEGKGYTLSGTFKATNAGSYTATATLEDGYVWDTTEGSTDAKSITWSIEKKTIAVPTAITKLVYNGKVQTGVAAGTGYKLENNTATNAGDYTAKATAEANYQFTGSKATADVKWSIAKKTIAVPAAITKLVYNGKVQTGVAAGTGYTLKSNTATNAGDYTAKATAAANYQFTGGKATADVKWSIAKADLSKATVTLAKASASYTGKKQTSGVKSVKLGSKTLTVADYTAKAASGNAAGKYTATVTGKGNYTGKATAKFEIKQAKNTAKAKKTSVKKTFKVKNLKKKAATVALPKVTTKFGTAKWKVSTKDKKKVLTLKNGKIQVKKGAKKGTYTIKLKANVTKTKNYKAASTKVVTVKVTVKK